MENVKSIINKLDLDSLKRIEVYVNKRILELEFLELSNYFNGTEKQNKIVIDKLKNLIRYPSTVNLDYADVNSIIKLGKKIQIIKGVKIPTKVAYQAKGLIIIMQIKRSTSLSEIHDLTEKICSNLKNSTSVVWGATRKSSIKRVRVYNLIIT